MSEFGNFNAMEIEPAVPGNSEPLPAGQYRAAIAKSEWKKTKAGTGRYLELVFEVLAGEQKGRRVWVRLNLENPSTTAVEIARRELSAICRSIGVMTPKQSQQLHDIPLLIDVVVKERDDKPGAYSNEVSGYSPIEAQTQPSTPSVNDDPF